MTPDADDAALYLAGLMIARHVPHQLIADTCSLDVGDVAQLADTAHTNPDYHQRAMHRLKRQLLAHTTGRINQ